MGSQCAQAIAGVDPHDAASAAAGLPQIDSINMWPLLSGTNVTGTLFSNRFLFIS